MGANRYSDRKCERYGRGVAASVVGVVVTLVVVSSVVGPAGAVVHPEPAPAGATDATGTQELLRCERTDSVSGAVMQTERVRYEMSDGTNARYTEAVYRVLADGDLQQVSENSMGNWYMFSDEQNIDGSAVQVADALQRTRTDEGRPACVYTTVVRMTASNGDEHLVRARTALVAGEAGATTTVRIRNVGVDSAEIDTPDGRDSFIEDGVRLGSLELADKSGRYQFYVPSSGTQLFNGTDYWTDYPLPRDDPAVVAFTEGSRGEDAAIAMTYHSGTTPPNEVMTEDGNSPRQMSDVLTYDVEGLTLAPGESARWTISSAAFAPGDNLIQTYRDPLPEPTGLTRRGPIEPDTLPQQSGDGQTTDEEPDPVQTNVTVEPGDVGERTTTATPALVRQDINATVRNVSVVTSGGLGAFEVSITQAGEPLASTPDQPLPNGTLGLNYFSISHGAPSDFIREVRVTVGVDRSAIEALPNTERDEVTVYRYQNGRWQDLEASLVGVDGDEFVYQASAPGFSEWATGAQRPQFDITEARIDVSTIEVGEDLGVTVRITNTGDADGQYTTELLLDDETVASRDVSVASGGTRQIVFEEAVADPGEYTVLVNDERAGDVTVESANAASEASAGVPVAPIAGGGLAVVVLVVGAFLYLRD